MRAPQYCGQQQQQQPHGHKYELYHIQCSTSMDEKGKRSVIIMSGTPSQSGRIVRDYANIPPPPLRRSLPPLPPFDRLDQPTQHRTDIIAAVLLTRCGGPSPSAPPPPPPPPPPADWPDGVQPSAPAADEAFAVPVGAPVVLLLPLMTG
eukprot:GHVU01171499.1.p1 GENE.GHVU01171499.1~~GHVU01171499.1.p1  ORF type:complete len:149 (-),score=27.94 GHVU01171499.1:1132-1578(-)